jgi:hypothetical protein
VIDETTVREFEERVDKLRDEVERCAIHGDELRRVFDAQKENLVQPWVPADGTPTLVRNDDDSVWSEMYSTGTLSRGRLVCRSVPWMGTRTVWSQWKPGEKAYLPWQPHIPGARPADAEDKSVALKLRSGQLCAGFAFQYPWGERGENTIVEYAVLF